MISFDKRAVVFALGKGVAKYILTKWLIDFELAGKLAEELADMGSDSLWEALFGQQNSGDKLVAAVGKKMTAVYEASSLKKGSKEAVALEVARRLARFQLTAETLVNNQVVTINIAKQLLNDEAEMTKLFSQDEKQLYRNLMNHAAQAFVNSAELVEGFRISYVARLLQNQSKLEEMLEVITYEKDLDIDDFEKSYLDSVKRKLDRFEVFGLPELNQISRKQILSTAYISLNRSVNHIDIKPFYQEAREAGKNLLNRNYKINKITLPSIITQVGVNIHLEDVSKSLEIFLSGKRRCVIRGYAGSGKTTLLQWLAVRAAYSDFAKPLESWSLCVPFFIRLREFSEDGFPTIRALIERFVQMSAMEVPMPHIRRLLKSGRALILVDGIDELPQHIRAKMLDRLADFVAEYPTCRYVISSRPAAVKENLWPEWNDWISQEGFYTTSIADMDIEQVHAFIDAWHRACAESVSESEEKHELLEMATEVKSLIDEDESLQELAINPLLCAMICALYRNFGENMPSNKADLYKRCIELLLHDRDRGRKVKSVGDYARLNDLQMLSLLQDLAYEMFHNGYSEIERDEAERRFQRKMSALRIESASAADVCNLFISRTNLLRDPVVDKLQFTHLTFQEYLAAKEAVDREDFGVLSQYATDDKWRNMILFAVGHCTTASRNRLLRKFLARLSDDSDTSMADLRELVLLLMTFLGSSYEIDREIVEEILDQTVVVFPLRNHEEASIFSAAGNITVPLFAPQQLFSTHQIDFNEIDLYLEMLSDLGTDVALEQIGQYAKFFTANLENIAFDFLNYLGDFDVNQYISLVLSQLESLRAYYIDSNWDIDWDKLPNLKYLQLNHSSSINKIRHMPNLQTLAIRLEYESACDLMPLVEASSLRRLEIVSLFRNGTIILRIKHLAQLEHLLIDYPLSFSLAEELINLVNLRSLSVSVDNDTLPIICQMKRLNHLCITYFSNEDVSNNELDISSVANLENLETLDLVNCSIKSISPIANLPKLKQLFIAQEAEYDLSVLPPNVIVSRREPELKESFEDWLELQE